MYVNSVANGGVLGWGSWKGVVVRRRADEADLPFVCVIVVVALLV